eukprot:s2122_g22.t1
MGWACIPFTAGQSTKACRPDLDRQGYCVTVDRESSTEMFHCPSLIAHSWCNQSTSATCNLACDAVMENFEFRQRYTIRVIEE